MLMRSPTVIKYSDISFAIVMLFIYGDASSSGALVSERNSKMILEIIFLLGLSQLVLGVYLWLKVKDLYQYPNRLGFPVIGNLYYFYRQYGATSMNNMFNRVSKIGDELGEDMYFTFVHGYKTVVISCPHVIEKIAYHPNLADKSWFVYGVFNSLIKGIFAHSASDNEWKLRRKEMVTSLKKSNIEGHYHDSFVENGKDLNRIIESDKKNVDSVHYCTLFSVNVVRATLFGIKKQLPLRHGLKVGLEVFLNFASAGLANPAFGYLFFHMLRIIERLFFSNVLKPIEKAVKRAENNPPADVSALPLSVVVGLRNLKRNNSMADMRKELYEMVMAGSHTVSVALAGSLAFLATLPEIQEKAWQEQYEIFGNDRRDVTVADIKKMTYLDKFYKELLRFFSPSYIGKYTSGEIKVDGVTIPAGTFVLILLFKMRTDPKYWKDPLMFNPDRFSEEDSNRPKYSYAPFGVGVRACLGMQYSNNEIKILLSTILRRFKLSTTEKFENLIIEKNIMSEVANMPNIQAEERQY